MRLKDRVALVTGGAGGIGAAVATRFAAEGARVGVADIDPDAVEKVIAAIRGAGGESLGITLDVTSADQWKHAVEALVSRYGALHILVNNAGIYQRKELEFLSEAEWDRMMAINAKGPFLGTRTAIPAMRAAGGGSIVNISSTAGLKASIAAHYGASKGAVRLLTKSTAWRYAKDGIRCNSVHPGPVATAMGRVAVPEAGREARLAEMPLGRFGTPEEIANGVLFLASDESSFMTGSELVMDGGATAR